MALSSSSNYCNTLLSQVKQFTKGIFASTNALVDALKTNKSKLDKKKKKTQVEEENKVSAHLTGVVWEACEHLESYVLDNSHAVKLEFSKWMPLTSILVSLSDVSKKVE